MQHCATQTMTVAKRKSNANKRQKAQRITRDWEEKYYFKFSFNF
jgi:hypothetical protein